MQTTKLRQLWCLLQGDKEPFEVTVDAEQSVFQLKVLAKGNTPALSSAYPSHIVLWKVSMFQLPTYTFHSRCVARQPYKD